MLKEFIKYLTSSDSAFAKQFGFTHQNIALNERSKRCQAAWQQHLDNCHDFISSELNNLNSKSIAILGSGLMLETPIELFANCETIHLYDLSFGPTIRKLAGQDARIKLIERDLTGLIEKLTTNSNEPAPVTLDQNYDLVISANILSQLPFMAIRALVKHTKLKWTDHELAQLGSKLIQNHLELLRRQPHAIFIWDHTRSHIDLAGKAIETYSSTLNEALPVGQRLWQWEVSPYGEESSKYKVILEVSAGRI